jgi:hypothetical protein
MVLPLLAALAGRAAVGGLAEEAGTGGIEGLGLRSMGTDAGFELGKAEKNAKWEHPTPQPSAVQSIGYDHGTGEILVRWKHDPSRQYRFPGDVDTAINALHAPSVGSYVYQNVKGASKVMGGFRSALARLGRK